MTVLAYKDRRARFWSNDPALWPIGNVHSHPPVRISSPSPLADELIAHGYHKDLKSVDGRDINVFIEQLKCHPRYLGMIDEFGAVARLTEDELLAIVCYTGEGAYQDFRRSAAAGLWDRWPSFTENLIRGLEKLRSYDVCHLEPGQSLFHGITNATSEGKYGGGSETFWIKFMTPISTSRDRRVANDFLNSGVSSNALMLTLSHPFCDESLGPSETFFADISWLSQFPEEQEYLVFPVGDCMGGRFTRSYDVSGCLVREFSVGFSGDW